MKFIKVRITALQSGWSIVREIDYPPLL